MQFTGQEMICYNSLLDGEDIFGIQIPYPPIGNLKIYIEQTKIQLREHKITDENDHITEFGRIPIQLLALYKKAKRHVFLNQLRIALVEDENAIVIQKEKNLFTIRAYKRTEIFYALLKNAPFLWGKEGEKMEGKKKRFLSLARWMDSLEDCSFDAAIVIKKYVEKQAMEEIVCFSDNEKRYLYDSLAESKENATAKEMRQKLYQLMEV